MGIERDVVVGATFPKVLRKGLRWGGRCRQREQQRKGKEAGERMVGLLQSHGLGVWGSGRR